MVNENKVVSASARGFTVYYTDSHKHYNYQYDRLRIPRYTRLQISGGDTYKGKRYQQLEKIHFSPWQERIYKDAVDGLRSYSLEQLRSMSKAEKVEINKLHFKAQKVLNLWKQQIVGKLVDDLLDSWMSSKGPMRRFFELYKGYTHIKVTCPFSFKDLNLSKREVALKLIDEGLLPQNFFKVAA